MFLGKGVTKLYPELCLKNIWCLRLFKNQIQDTSESYRYSVRGINELRVKLIPFHVLTGLETNFSA